MKRLHLTTGLIITVIAIAMTSLIVYFAIYCYKYFYGPLNSFKKIQVGMDYNELIKQYGTPDYVANNQKELENYEYYKYYYPIPKRAISKKVSVYRVGPIFIMYLYINQENKIEYIHQGKT